MPTDPTESQLADELAKVAGWKYVPSPDDSTGVWTNGNATQASHPFPVGPVDPLLRHIREVLEPKGWRLEHATNRLTDTVVGLTRWRELRKCVPVRGEGDSLYSALARAIPAAHEVEEKSKPKRPPWVTDDMLKKTKTGRTVYRRANDELVFRISRDVNDVAPVMSKDAIFKQE